MVIYPTFRTNGVRSKEMTKLLDFSSVEHFVYDILCLLRKHSFFRRGVDRRNSWGGHELFACPKREGQHKLRHNKEGGHLNFIASQGQVTFFNKKYKGRAGRFYIHAHRVSSGPPTPPHLKDECSLNLQKYFKT